MSLCFERMFARGIFMDQLPTIAAAQRAMRTGQLTSIDLVEHCLARIDVCDKQIRAWVVVDAAGARREAERLTQLARRGEFVGPLHGVPIGVKDIIDVAGLPTRCGSPLRENVPPAEKDADVVAMLRRAGAIVLGKTVTTEWACFDPPPTRNPWNLAHTPGGSSSGSAAAVAMEMCMAAIGTQTGGSIIRPAAYCGVCGLKPTYMPEMMNGIAPVSFHLDHVGPLARNASDLAEMHWAMVGRNVRDEQTGLDVALVKDSFFDVASAEVRDAIESVWSKLGEQLPHRSEVIRLPASFAAVRQHHWCIMAVEASEVHREAFARNPLDFGVSVRSLIEQGLAARLHDYVAALKHRLHFSRELLPHAQQAWLWAMPSTPATAPGPETTGDARFNAPWSYVGWPALTIPCGLGEGGLPIGLQLVAPPWSERSLLEAAAWIEERIGFAERPTRWNEGVSP
jgi:aspartyl-tRNA(Asn)/glutamyl-tRNA(Gln) amidotransferase subunit A